MPVKTKCLQALDIIEGAAGERELFKAAQANRTCAAYSPAQSAAHGSLRQPRPAEAFAVKGRHGPAADNCIKCWVSLQTLCREGLALTHTTTYAAGA